MTCTWCAHPDHPPGCPAKINKGTERRPDWHPCPCKRK